MPRHTWLSFRRYGWREGSTVIGGMLVVVGCVLFFTLTRAQIEEYTGRLLALTGMLAAGVAVWRGIVGIVRNTSGTGLPPEPPQDCRR